MFTSLDIVDTLICPSEPFECSESRRSRCSILEQNFIFTPFDLLLLTLLCNKRVSNSHALPMNKDFKTYWYWEQTRDKLFRELELPSRTVRCSLALSSVHVYSIKSLCEVSTRPLQPAVNSNNFVGVTFLSTYAHAQVTVRSINFMSEPCCVAESCMF